MSLHTPPDIAGDNAIHNLGDLAAANSYSAPYTARAVQVTVVGSGTARLGDDKTSSSRGLPVVAPNGGQFLPYVGENCFYSLGALYLYVPSGATASVAWED